MLCVKCRKPHECAFVNTSIAMQRQSFFITIIMLDSYSIGLPCQRLSRFKNQFELEGNLERGIRHRYLLTAGHKLRKLLLQVRSRRHLQGRRRLVVQSLRLGAYRRLLELTVSRE